MKPLAIGITAGDPNGIGPEVALKAALQPQPANRRLVLVGHRGVWERAAAQLGRRLPPEIPDLAPPLPRRATWDPDMAPPPAYRPGQVRADAVLEERLVGAGEDGDFNGGVGVLELETGPAAVLAVELEHDVGDEGAEHGDLAGAALAVPLVVALGWAPGAVGTGFSEARRESLVLGLDLGDRAEHRGDRRIPADRVVG